MNAFTGESVFASVHSNFGYDIVIASGEVSTGVQKLHGSPIAEVLKALKFY